MDRKFFPCELQVLSYNIGYSRLASGEISWLTFADCRLQTADCRVQTANCRPRTVDYKRRWLTAGRKILKTAELNPTQILVVLNDRGKEWACVDSVTLTFTRRWPRKAYWGTITSRLAYSSVFFFFTKNGNEHNSGRREFTSMWMRGALLLSVVYQHSPWIHKQFYRGRVVFPRTVYLDGGFPR